MPQIATPHEPRAPSARHLRLPPFGRELMEMRSAGLVPARGIIVVSLDSWDFGKGHARVVVPPELEPDTLNFAFIAAVDCALIHVPRITPIERRDSCIRTLLRFNPTRLLVCEIGDVTRLQWIKSKAVGVELEEFR